MFRYSQKDHKNPKKIWTSKIIAIIVLKSECGFTIIMQLKATDRQNGKCCSVDPDLGLQCLPRPVALLEII